MSLYIMHYGVGHDKGGHSGRYPWGSGKRPYGGKKIFISGASKTGDPESEYYGEPLPNAARKIILDTAKFGDQILVGDAPGVDRQVQDLLKNFKNVTVYTISDKPRYIANKNWKVKTVKSNDQVDKDKAMANDADGGIAIPIVGRSQKTRDNVERLLQQNKEVKVFEIEKASDKARRENKVYKTLSDDEKRYVWALDKDETIPKNFTNTNEMKKFNYAQFIDSYRDKPVAVFDLWVNGDRGFDASIMTDSKHRGQGHAYNVAKKGQEWVEKNYPRGTKIYWGAMKDNTGSRKLAEKLGYDFIDEDGKTALYIYTSKGDQHARR